jgi:transcriptional regulator with GAF, ATPase, and Fis domain
MLSDATLQRVQASPLLSRWTITCLLSAERAASTEAWVDEMLESMAKSLQTQSIGFVRAESGAWRFENLKGEPLSPPESLLAESLDQEKPIRQRGHVIIPLPRYEDASEALVWRARGESGGDLEGELIPFGEIFIEGLKSVRERSGLRRRAAQLAAVLEIAAQWQNTLETDELLRKIAEASTKLLQCERASIFLWDKPRKQLVGRPALGVEEGELRIPDSAGVVGAVIQTGESRRVTSQTAGEIDRRVDNKLGFTTSNLLCVPMKGRSGERIGAFEILNKKKGEFTPDDEIVLEELAGHAAIAIENSHELKRLIVARDRVADQAASGLTLIGESQSIIDLRKKIDRIADSDLTVLVLGENGSGKEVVSRQIHYGSKRRSSPLVAVNCAAITETLLESELFGHEKGAFTDARESRAGKFEIASGGTLFLDEIGDMSLGGQAKLLRALEEKVITRVGGSRPISIDTRVVAATNQNLAELVRQKRFREDLYFRLSVVTLDLPPLRDRDDDVLLLAEHFLDDMARRSRRKAPKLSTGAKNRIRSHTWPGNVRELRNLMERLLFLTEGDVIDAEDISFQISPRKTEPSSSFSTDLPLADATTRFQVEYIQKHIQLARGNMTLAAQRMGLHRSNLYRKMKQLGMETDSQDDRGEE